MMNYDVFKKEVECKFMDYMPEQFKDMQLRITPVNKINQTLDGIGLVSNGAGRCVSPINVNLKMYIFDLIRMYTFDYSSSCSI